MELQNRVRKFAVTICTSAGYQGTHLRSTWPAPAGIACAWEWAGCGCWVSAQRGTRPTAWKLPEIRYLCWEMIFLSCTLKDVPVWHILKIYCCFLWEKHRKWALLNLMVVTGFTHEVENSCSNFCSRVSQTFFVCWLDALNTNTLQRLFPCLCLHILFTASEPLSE